MKSFLISFALLLISLMLIVLPLTPISLAPRSFTYPDLVTGLLCGWIIRRPTSTPFGLILLIGFFTDIFWMKPIGLWTILVLIMSEILKNYRRYNKQVSFLFELFIFTILFSSMHLVQEVVFLLTFIKSSGGISIISNIFITIMSYPLIIFFIQYVIRVRFEEVQNYGNIATK